MSNALPTRACKHCGEQVAWVRTTNGNAMPLDPQPDAAGIVFVSITNGSIVARVGKRGETLDGVRYTAHFATCSVLNKHRTTAPNVPHHQPRPSSSRALSSDHTRERQRHDPADAHPR